MPDGGFEFIGPAAGLNPEILKFATRPNPFIFSPVTVIPVPDNKPFVKKFDPTIFDDVVTRPTRVIVVNQDPAAGDFVPSGTPVTVTTTVKGFIPLDSFKGLHEVVTGSFNDVGEVVTKIEETEAKEVVVKETKYADLSAGDKAKLTGIFEAVDLGDADDATKGQVFEDFKFIYGF